jgi:hypothetical protein
MPSGEEEWREALSSAANLSTVYPLTLSQYKQTENSSLRENRADKCRYFPDSIPISLTNNQIVGSSLTFLKIVEGSPLNDQMNQLF